MTQRIAVVTGANRGIGREVCRQLALRDCTVVLTSRDAKKGNEAAHAFQEEGLDVTAMALDVTDPESVQALRDEVEHRFSRVDVLVNNAGILPDSRKNPEGISILTARLETLRTAMETNVYGALHVAQLLVPLMRKHDYGRIVNVSSGMGQLSEMGGGYPGYRISKTALNAVTRVLSQELLGENILVNSVCPGWVRTDMGGPSATRSLEQGAAGIVWAATLPNDGPTGGFFRDGEPLAW